MAQWIAFPHASAYHFSAASVKKHWHHLHAGDQEPLPKSSRMLAAWALLHRGEFEKAYHAALLCGSEGTTLANKTVCLYANYLEPKEKLRLELFNQVVQRATQQIQTEPRNANAHYWQAYALGRYSQGISVAKALAQGIGSKVKSALETAIRLEPRHADALSALGSFHAEVIDKVGALIGNMTYGAKRDTSLALFQKALNLTPDSPLVLVEYANALVMLDGDKRLEEATHLYERAAAMQATDAVERLEIELAQAELESD